MPVQTRIPAEDKWTKLLCQCYRTIPGYLIKLYKKKGTLGPMSFHSKFMSSINPSGMYFYRILHSSLKARKF